MFKGIIHLKLIFHQFTVLEFKGQKKKKKRTRRTRQTYLIWNCGLNAAFIDSEHSSSILISSVIFYFLIGAQQVPGSL